jgi:hypothetical protein
MVMIYIDYTNGREEFDLSPFNTVYFLRRLLAEDHKVMESRLHIYRHGEEINDETVLNPSDVVQVAIETICSKKRKLTH